MLHPSSTGTLQLLVLGTQLVSTFAMFGLIWFVQVVHYPLFLRTDPATFAAFEAEHAFRTGWVAAPLMIAELLSSLLLLNHHLRPPAIPATLARVGAALAVLTWLSTFLLQVPLHNRLHHGFDSMSTHRLIVTNWLRTALWTARAGLITYTALHLLTR